jgi:hypothetical protein
MSRERVEASPAVKCVSARDLQASKTACHECFTTYSREHYGMCVYQA